jgi:glutathione S-transferase
MAVNGILDTRMPLVTVRFTARPAEALEQFGAQTLPRLLTALEKLLTEGGGPYLCGPRLTYADCSLFELLIYARDECPAGTDV